MKDELTSIILAENVAPQSLVFRRKQEAQQNVAPQSLVFRRKEQSQKNVAPQSLVFRRDDESNSEKRDDAESAEGSYERFIMCEYPHHFP